MAKAVFHKNQRVYVKPVGTWALIEHVVPHWTKGLVEPIRVHYDCGLGREFAAEELQAEDPMADNRIPPEAEHWHVMRARNKWQPSEDCGRHPFPGTYPVIVTTESEWGGWRVPGAEYDMDPHRIERQARMIATAPRLAAIAGALIRWARHSGEEMPVELAELAHGAQDLLSHIDGE
jgi:hypothetical protein